MTMSAGIEVYNTDAEPLMARGASCTDAEIDDATK